MAHGEAIPESMVSTSKPSARLARCMVFAPLSTQYTLSCNHSPALEGIALPTKTNARHIAWAHKGGADLRGKAPVCGRPVLAAGRHAEPLGSHAATGAPAERAIA